MRALPSLITLVVAACGCMSNGDHGAQPRPDSSLPSPDGPGETDAAVLDYVVLAPAGRPEARVRVDLARTELERQRGLMYVQNLPIDDGMLFIFERESILTFWMKNTLIPLDMIFIRADLTVAGIVANAEPLTLTGRSIGKPSQYVLEVNGGWAAQHGVAEGTVVRFENFTP